VTKLSPEKEEELVVPEFDVVVVVVVVVIRWRMTILPIAHLCCSSGGRILLE
jgi:hypothetical protein